jgi:uncharacterized MAPEG superfamily protein
MWPTLIDLSWRFLFSTGTNSLLALMRSLVWGAGMFANGYLMVVAARQFSSLPSNHDE